MRFAIFLIKTIVVVAVLAAAGGIIAVRASSPVEVFDALMPRDGGARQIARDVTYGPGDRNTLDIYAPEVADAAAPVLIFFYGGSWNSGTKNGYGFAGNAFAARGFVTLVPDYGLHPERAYPGFLEDCAAVVKWAREHAADFGGDPDRIVLVGHSAGAYNAAMLALDPRWLAGAGVPREAIRAWAGLSGPYDFLPLDDKATIRTFSHVADLAATQPLHHAGAGDPPAFLGHGADDMVVGPYHTRNMRDKLTAASVPVEAKFYAGLAHSGVLVSMARPLRWRAPVLDDAANFLIGHAKR